MAPVGSAWSERRTLSVTCPSDASKGVSSSMILASSWSTSDTSPVTLSAWASSPNASSSSSSHHTSSIKMSSSDALNIKLPPSAVASSQSFATSFLPTKTMPVLPSTRPLEVDASLRTAMGAAQASCATSLLPTCTNSLPPVSFESLVRGMVGGGSILSAWAGGEKLNSSAGGSFASRLLHHVHHQEVHHQLGALGMMQAHRHPEAPSTQPNQSALQPSAGRQTQGVGLAMSLGSMRHSAPWFNESIAAGTHPLTQTSTTTSHAAHANTNGQDTSEACRTRHQEGPEEGMTSSTSVAIKNHLSRDKVVEIFLARQRRSNFKHDSLSYVLAKEHHVTPKTVRDIWSMRSWKAVTLPHWTASDHQLILAHHLCGGCKSRGVNSVYDACKTHCTIWGKGTGSRAHFPKHKHTHAQQAKFNLNTQAQAPKL